jgi:hypothetical protein
MEARLVTSQQHQYTVPEVREHAPSEQTTGNETRALSQRDLVAASLLACPNYSGAAPKRA